MLSFHEPPVSMEMGKMMWAFQRSVLNVFVGSCLICCGSSLCGYIMYVWVCISSSTITSQAKGVPLAQQLVSREQLPVSREPAAQQTVVPNCSKLGVLGMTIDSELSFDGHVPDVVRACNYHIYYYYYYCYKQLITRSNSIWRVPLNESTGNR